MFGKFFGQSSAIFFMFLGVWLITGNKEENHEVPGEGQASPLIPQEDNDSRRPSVAVANQDNAQAGSWSQKALFEPYLRAGSVGSFRLDMYSNDSEETGLKRTRSRTDENEARRQSDESDTQAFVLDMPAQTHCSVLNSIGVREVRKLELGLFVQNHQRANSPCRSEPTSPRKTSSDARTSYGTVHRE